MALPGAAVETIGRRRFGAPSTFPVLVMPVASARLIPQIAHRASKPKIRTMTARDRRAFVTGRRLAHGSTAVTLRRTRRLIGLTEFDCVAALVARERRRLDATSCVLKHKSVSMGLFSTLVFDC
jgi:hypothetical protein